MDGLAAHVDGLLKEIQQALFDRAVAFRTEHTSTTVSYDDVASWQADARPASGNVGLEGASPVESDFAPTEAAMSFSSACWLAVIFP